LLFFWIFGVLVKTFVGASALSSFGGNLRMKNSKPKKAMKTGSARAPKRPSYLEKREKAVAKKIQSVEKALMSYPPCKNGLKRLRPRRRKFRSRKNHEVAEIEELAATFKPQTESA
jgi:hypothetical protein